jgi:choice-of-anchor A domain-containing protein/uncharacterized repeat protein (TIGR01451 family)
VLLLLGLGMFGAFAPARASNPPAHRALQSATCGSGLLGVAASFNVFVEHDYAATAVDVQGRAGAGGNVSVTSYNVGVALPPNSSRIDLIAAGNLTIGGGGAQAQNGSVTYGGALQGSITTPNGQVTRAAPPFDFAAEFTSLASQSLALAALAPNGSAGGPSYAFDLTGTSATTNVFALTATDLQKAQVIRIKVPFGSSTVVNVTGDSYTTAAFPTAAIQFWNGSAYVQLNDSTTGDLEALRRALLWNFPSATSVQIGPNLAWEGTVLAPHALVKFPGSTQLNGTLIAASLPSSSGAARNHPFDGCADIGPPPPTVEALDDQYSVGQDKTLEIEAPGVLANDTFPDGSTPKAALVGKPAHGTATLAANGSFTYRPEPKFVGTDVFTYRFQAGGVTSNTAKATIMVEKGKPTLLTLVARVCPSYSDVTANLARNDIQESLADLGADTRYDPGQPIDPTVEHTYQPNCRPLPGWRFTLGTGYQTRAVSGPWGSLSIVTGAYATDAVTEESVPLLNDQGEATGRMIRGAVTVPLTDEQADRAATPDSLWIQGGTPEDPALFEPYPGEYGFAALRCAVDNLNGDNVEWIGYPAGASHVFCYAYYVKPPPTSGTIVVRKEVSDPHDATQSFPFEGNVTFNADGRFSLDVENGAPAETTFYRAATGPDDSPWTFAEDVPPGWHLNGIKCSSNTGASKWTTSLDTAKTSVRLGAGDTVTCTYTDSLTPPHGVLQLSKTTVGGVGTFEYSVSHGNSRDPVATATATTTQPNLETAAKPASISLDPGHYEIRESLPVSSSGRWTLTSVTCDGKPLPAVSPVSVTITGGAGTLCSFENTFVPAGSITIYKRTYGNTGTVGFTISPLDSSLPPASYDQTAQVKAPGIDVRATGDPTNMLPLGSYKLQEYAPGGTYPEGWDLTSVVCNGTVVAASQGSVVVTLTAAEPAVSCTFTNTWMAPPVPPNPPEPPEPPVPPDPDPIPSAEIHITKTADAKKIEVGQIVTYTVTVSNTGNATADGVVVAEQTPLKHAELVSVSPSQGNCQTTHVPASCDLGTIDPGRSATILVKLRGTSVGATLNRVAVSAKTQVLEPPTADREVEVTKPDHSKPPSPGTPHPQPHPSKPGESNQPPTFTG